MPLKRYSENLWRSTEKSESQERNTAQLERIGAVVEQKWGLKEGNKKEESKDDKEGSRDSSRKIQEEGTLSFASC